MTNPLQARWVKIGTAAVMLTAGLALAYWVRSSIVPKTGNADEGEFLLFEEGERELDGAPALSLTFTLPLDARQSYDTFIRVFEMPAPPRPPNERRFDFDEENRPGSGGTVVSTKPEDTKVDGGAVVAGAWIGGEHAG